MIGPGTIGFRLIAFALAWIVGAIVAGGLLLSSLFEDHVRRGFDDRIEVLLETLVTVTDADPATGVRLLGAQGEPRFERPFSGWYWQIEDKQGIRLASRSLWDQALDLPSSPTADADGISRYELPGPRGQKLRVVERPIRFDAAGTPFRYAVAGDLAEAEAELRPFRVTLAWSLGLLGLGLIAAVVIQVHFGLGPLRRLRTALARVRAGTAEKLEGDFPGEIRPLVNEANQLIAHVSDVVERARTHVGNLAHALKTPLSVLAVEAEKAGGEKDTGLAGTVARETARMRERIDHHLARARTAASAALIGQRTEVLPVAEGLARALTRMHAERIKAIPVEVPATLVFRGDSQDIEEMLGNLMENACKWAKSQVRVGGAAAPGGRLRLWVEDDGPGLRPEDRERATARGARLDESVPGSGLGLNIVSEIAALYGGKLILGTASLGGLKAEIDLPAAVG
ncbi:MAG: sensor histidine kinase [Alphaproteobacteria bacterium]